MPVPAPEARALAERYALALGTTRRGPIGEQLGRRSGGSLEFEDRREWQMGDDVRRLDWRALARTDTLYVRLYREEILPRLELVLDASASLAAEPHKAELAVDLAALLALSARGAGYEVALVLLGDRPERVELERFLARGAELAATTSLGPGAEGWLRAGALRVVVSDFLVPGGLAERLRALGARAGALALVQVLGRFDAEPEEGDALRLTDAESGAALELVLDERAVGRYRARLASLETELATEARRLAAPLARLVAGSSLADLCRAELVPAGILVPR